MIEISEKCMLKLKSLLENKNKKWVRLLIKGSGCAGFSYSFELTDEKNDWEKILNDIILIDEMFYFSLDAEIDFIETDFESKLILNIKNKHSSCGCGKSFSL